MGKWENLVFDDDLSKEFFFSTNNFIPNSANSICGSSLIKWYHTSCMPIIFFIRWKNNENCFLQERNSITKEEKKNTTEIDNLIYIMLLFTFHLIWKHWVFRYAFHGIIALSWNLCRIFIFIIPHTHTHTQTCFNAYKELFHLNFLPKHLLQL